MRFFKYIGLMLGMLIAFPALAQYNPENPPEPNEPPKPTAKYRLTVVADPENAVSSIFESGKYVAGETLYLWAYTRSGFDFLKWEDAEGNLISEDSSCAYMMPARDVTIYARLKYSPTNPSEPSQPAVDYAQVRLSVSPSKAGSVSGEGKYLIGSTISVYAYANSGYVFRNWTRNGEVLSMERNLQYVVVKGDNNLVANYDYSPDSPAEPSSPAKTYKLTLDVSPAAAGYTNPASGNSYKAGETISLNAYANSGFSFVSWTSASGEILSESSRFSYTMPETNTVVRANFKYNPGSPGEPSEKDPQRNVIYGGRISANPGAEIFYDVNLENIDPVSGINIDVTLPDGFTADYSRCVMTARASAHTFSSQAVEGNTQRIFIRGSENLSGGSGAIIRIPVKIAPDAEAGAVVPVKMSRGVIVKTDGSQTSVDAIDGIIKIADAVIGKPSGPDFVIENISVPAVSVMPDENISISWVVANRGDVDATGGWTETLSLVNTDNRRVILGTLYYDTRLLKAGESVSRNAVLPIPSMPGIDGDLNVRIDITPSAVAGEPDDNQLNNIGTTTDAPVALGKRLILSLPEFIEEGPDASARASISRSGNWNQSQTFTLSKISGDSRLRIPASVVIPAEQSAAYFLISVVDNNELDESEDFSISVSGNGYEAVTGNLKIIDDEFPAIQMEIADDPLIEGESTTITLLLPRPLSAPLEVKITCDTPDRFSYPVSVIIPAGSDRWTFDITAIDNEKIENVADVTFRATAPHYETGEIFVTLYDNDMPALEMTLTPMEVSENAGQKAIRGVLKRTSNFDKQVTIQFTDNKPGNLTYNSKMTMEKGVNEIDFVIGVQDNAVKEGDRIVQFTAAVFLQNCGCSATGESGGAVKADIYIIDDDGASLSLSSNSTTLRRDARESTVIIERNTSDRDPLQVSLYASPEGIVSLPEMILIPSGAKSATFKIEAPQSSFTGVEQNITLNAIAEGFSKGTLLILLSDRTLPDATVSLKPLGQKEYMPGEEIPVVAVVKNQGNTVMPDAVPVDIYINSQSQILACAHTTGILPVDETEEVAIPLKAPSVPGNYTLTAHVNDANNFAELTRTNNTSESVSFTVLSPFTGALQASSKVINPGETVKISGKAPGYASQLEIYYITNKIRFSEYVMPDASGNFETDIIPQVSGDYIAGICVPGENKADEMASFTVRGIKLSGNDYITVDIAAGDSHTESIRIYNNSSEPVSGLKIETPSYPATCSIDVDCGETIDANGYTDARITFSALGVTNGEEWETGLIAFTTAEGIEISKPYYFYARPASANLVPSVKAINTTMTMGSPRSYRVTLGNTGKAPTGTITLSLPPFMQAGTPASLPSVEPGGYVNLDIVLTASPEMQLNVPVSGQIGINCANGNGVALPYSVEPVSSLTGHLIVDVKDEYTFYTAESPHVADADVLISHPVTGKLIASGKTDENGVWTADVPEGMYTIKVSASQHESRQGTLQVAPGTDTLYPVFLPFTAISYSWEVEETTVDDSYEIITTVDFETRVPKPVVLIDFPEIPYHNGIVYVTATNVGLITADNITLLLPEPEDFMTLEQLGDVWKQQLLPGESVRFPIKVSVPYDDIYGTEKAMAFIDVGSAGDSPSRYGDMGSNVPSLPARASSSSSDCHTVEMAVEVDDYECDPETGNPIYTGKKKTTGSYTYGSCDRRGWIGGHPGGGWTGPGWSAPGNPGHPGGGGTNNPQSSTYYADRLRTILMTGCLSDCEKALADAIKACLDALGECTGMSPDFGLLHKLYNCGKGLWDNCRPSQIKTASNSLGCGTSAAGCVPGLGCPASIFDCIKKAYEAFMECMKNNKKHIAPYGNPMYEEETDNAVERRVESYMLVMESFDIQRKNILNLLGDGGWSRIGNDELAEMLTYIAAHCDEDGYAVVNDELLKGKPASVDTESFMSFIERYNNSQRWTLTGEESDNMVDIASWNANTERMEEIFAMSDSLGYPTFMDMVQVAAEENDYLNEIMEEDNGGVCASITLEFSQTMVMTRQAFRGTLTITNGNEEKPMTDVKFLVQIRDEEGEQVGEREFAVMTETLSGFKGDPDLTSGWELGVGETGKTTVLFIPSKYAAPVESRIYSFGGILSYTDPFTDTQVSRELVPIEMTVTPSPLLQLDYFMQRDIMGDDPLTPDRIEPSEDAEFALILRNAGYGNASNVVMTTSQPKIVENSKGLAIDFRIVGTSLNGKESNLAMGERIPTEFGDIAPNSTAYAQWWMRSSLMGHFTSYDVKANQLSAYGSEDMSLLDYVEIHELIHGLTPESEEKGGRAFLANDIADTHYHPDMIYFAGDASASPVGEAGSVDISRQGDNVFKVNVSSLSPGWVYGEVDGLWQGSRKVASVIRLSDGKELPADNFWCSYVTLHNSADPIYEDKLHFAVEIEDEDSYLVTLDPLPDLELDIVAFNGIPTDDKPVNYSVKKVDVVFNKPVDATTFGVDDITVVCQGKKCDLAGVRILSSDNPSVFTIDLADACKTGGYYNLLIDLTSIKDVDGFSGREMKSAAWIQYPDGLVKLSMSVSPAESGSVSPQSGDYEAGEPVTLRAYPEEGYEFVAWQLNGIIVSQSAEYVFTPTDDTEIIANFRLTQHKVEIVFNPEHGEVTGASSGIFAYGTLIDLWANPTEGYEFVHWQDEMGNVLQIGSRYTFTVKGDAVVKALFAEKNTGVGTVADNVVCDIWPNPVRALLHISGDFSKISKVEFTDINGRHVKIYKDIPTDMPLNVESLPQGIYILRIFTDKGISTHRLVKL